MKITKGLQFVCVNSGAYDNLFTVGKRYDSEYLPSAEAHLVMQDNAV